MNQKPGGANKKLLATIAVLVVTVLIVMGVKAFDSRRVAAPGMGGASSNRASNPAANAAQYKDGTYTATGNYESPGGAEALTVSLTLAHSIVSNASVQPGANDPDAQEFQTQFIQDYRSFVVGKNIADIHLSKVSGSSLTSQGFNDALEQIKSQAKI